MYIWVVYLHVMVIFVFLIQHAVEIWVSFKLRQQEEPEGVYAAYSFLPDNNTMYLRINYLLIIATGITACFLSTWWKNGWMWTSLGIMVVIWGVMSLVAPKYLDTVDAIAEDAMKNRDDESALDKFKSDLKARREPEILIATSAIGGFIILWLMMYKPY
jgi:hypothetical protein